MRRDRVPVSSHFLPSQMPQFWRDRGAWESNAPGIIQETYHGHAGFYDRRFPRYHAQASLDHRSEERINTESDDEEDFDAKERRTYVSRKQATIRLPFEKAMRQLFKRVTVAETCYSEFRSEFDNDISSIKDYATPELLDSIWAQKVVCGNSVQKTSGESQDISQNDAPSVKSKNKEFVQMQQKLSHALENATAAKLPEISGLAKRTKSRQDAAKRLQRKVGTAKEQLSDLLKMATGSFEVCGALLNELAFLKLLIDPDSDMNRDVLKSSSSGASETEDIDDD